MYRTHGVVVIVALIFLGLASGMPCQAADQSLITVTGEAEVRVNADEVIISLGDRECQTEKRSDREKAHSLDKEEWGARELYHYELHAHRAPV